MPTEPTEPRANENPRAKRPVTKAAGPYGHPIHPLLVTVPIGAWVMSFVFDIVSQLSGNGGVFAVGALWLIGFGLLGSLVAGAFGFLDLLAIPSGTRAFQTALAHLAINSVVVALFVVSFILRRDALDGGPVPGVLVAMSAVLLAALGVSGWLGGRLTYRYGVRVAGEETQVEGFRRTPP